MSTDFGRSRRIYRILLRAYPARTRARFGREMEDAFVAMLRLDIERSVVLGAVRCWVGAVSDCVVGGLAARFGRRSETYSGGVEVMGTILSDLRYAARALARRPVFSVTAILTIAIGVGANASVFTVVNGFLLTPLPYDDPDELVALWAEQPSLGWTRTDVNPADAWDWRERANTLEDVIVFDSDGFNLTGGDKPELVDGLRVTPNYLAVLGVEPVLGRDFGPEEIGEGRDRVVILTDSFWERRFARDPDVLGSTLTLDGQVVDVIGVLPETYMYHEGLPDLLRPWAERPEDTRTNGHYTKAIGRLTDGADFEAARTELREIARQLESEYAENEGWTVLVTPFHREVTGEVALSASAVLMTAVGFILLMACVNVANLLLARGSARAREISVRIALGAGRRRVVRQLLTESLVLASAGGLIGLVLASWGYRAIVGALPPTLPPVFQFEIDTSVLAFTVAITVGAALLFGVLPALRVSSLPSGALRDGARAGRSRGSGRFGSALVVLQTAMAVVLLTGGGLLMKSIAGMRSQDFGFDSANVLTARLSLPEAEYATKEASDEYWRAVTERLRSSPGIVEVGTTQSHPLMGSNWGRTVRIAGQETAEDREFSVRLTYASPGLFEALRFQMVRGRMFDDSDDADAPDVVIVNEAFVEQYLGSGADALSTTVLSGERYSAAIVGVVHDVLERRVEERPGPAMYVPIAQADVRTRSLVVRTAADPGDQRAGVEEAVWAVDADLPVYGFQTMDALVEDRIGGFAVIGYLMAVFALLSLLLGAVGIYGVTAYAAGRRTSEIGVRLAMGAERTDVVRMVVSEGSRRALSGLVIGLALAFGLGGGLSGVLVDVSPRDPLTFAGVTGVLAAVSLLGLYLPARRAARVDPVRALTAE